MGLLRGIARTAVVAGTATAVSNRVSQRQAGRRGMRGAGGNPQQGYPQQGYPQQQQYPPPGYPPQAYPQQPVPQPPPGKSDLSSQLAELTDLRDRGVLTDQEFAAAKAKLLGI